ncbi:syntaxin, putative [Eimeria acervulina]|uniref:Syntaxin, putative n=1 Tax=Eimeria acervulina TaxID=5801 RepID=U6GMK3_EIMAC|nr:syntaxin, putative [Eimeria acervulina]CDI81446.1 syntaxin, putative [Eimeria acervulina]
MAAPLVMRDLSPLFFRFKAEAKEKRLRFSKPSVCVPSPTNRSATNRMCAAMVVQVDALEELHDDLAHIKERMSQLQKVQQRRLLQVFGDSHGDTAIGNEIDTHTASITQLFYRCEVKLQKICPPGVSTGAAAEARMQQNAQKAVAAQLHSLNQAFRQQQKAYLEGKQDV